jgi:hypothetical protein
VWANDGRISAVRPQEAFLPHFQALGTAQSQWGKFGAEGGSDGGQTRVRHRIEIMTRGAS